MVNTYLTSLNAKTKIQINQFKRDLRTLQM